MLASSYEFIGRDELFDKLLEALEERRGPRSAPRAEVVPRANVADPLRDFIGKCVVRTADPGDVLRRSEVYAAYKEFCSAAQPSLLVPLSKRDFNERVVRHLGEPIAKSDSLSNFWRGFQLRWDGLEGEE